MMLDPAYARMSFAQLCSRVGLSSGEVLRLICQRQLAEGMIHMAYHLPDTMENVAFAALGQRSACVKCVGKGIISGSTCTDCCGSGEFRIRGDIRALRLVFEIHAIAGKNRAQG
jgi:DnaJ-class molecular chaperone